MNILLFLIVVVIVLMAYGLTRHKPDKTNVLSKSDNTSKQNEPAQQEQPTHFDLLDDNGDPINAPKMKIVIGGGDSDAPVQELKYFCIKDKGYHVSVWPKDDGIQGVDYLEFPIAGITHGEHIDEHLGEFAATLEPDPANPYDQNAIKIVTREGHRVGYVPKDQTAYVRDFTTLPCRCYCYIGTNDGFYFTDCYITKNDQ
ncbi:MAG: hypothetical protein J6C44_09465 [Muribaculaceae bacterium]|nr:hypothetical protein [Muribaculaceae bacterium]MBP3573683.1 hypothetical protein [Prevotella sp.]